MSHTVKVKVEFKVTELPQLSTALKALGWHLVENAEARQYNGRKTYRWVAINPDKSTSGYDVGISQKGEQLELYTDFYNGSVERTLGAHLCKLKQEFAVAVVEDEFPNANIIRTNQKDGNVLLEIEQWA